MPSEYHLVDYPREGGAGGDLNRLREIYKNETCKTAVRRTRRAECNAKAMEAIIDARLLDGLPKDEILIHRRIMVAEDYRSQLVDSLESLKKMKLAVSELSAQQAVDADNIESLQKSLERLHAVSAEYRSDRDALSKELVDLYETVKQVTRV
jgi:chromatin segregation and condensation protein Rec8/ScpA/Scc1 (kleisin family)